MITIQTNKRNRRILMLDSTFNLDENHDFSPTMFDAVFILSPSPDEVKTILHTVNPVTSVKCCYKPFLALKSVKGELDEYAELIDIFTYDINDTESLDVVDEIISSTEKVGLSNDHEKITSGNIFFIRLCRYLIARGKTTLEPELHEDSSLGYVIPIFELFFSQGAYSLSEYIMFYQSLLEKGYIKVLRFINKIYLCPSCLRSHLLYIESCPRCHHSSIKSEDVIHHFRCANISPEHTYNFGGQLRCPKCHQLLRHIGVDYDRPSVVYTCSHCDNMFLQPQMTVVCTSCHSTSEVSDLTPHDVTAFEFTPQGREAIVSPNIGFTIYTDFFDNYMDYDRFVGRLRLLSELNAAGHDVETSLTVARIWVLDDNETTVPLRGDIIALFCKRFPAHKVSSANNMVYIKGIVKDEDGIATESNEDFRASVEQVLWQASALLMSNERICYILSGPVGTNLDEFVASLRFVSPTPDKIYLSSNDSETKQQLKQEAEAVSRLGSQETQLEEETESQEESVEEENLTLETEETEDSSADETAMRRELAQMDKDVHHSPIRRMLIIALVVILVVIAAAVCWFFIPKTLGNSSSKSKGVVTMVQTPDTTAETAEKAALSETAEEEKQPTDGTIQDMQSGRYYVVTATLLSEEQVTDELKRTASNTDGEQPQAYRYGQRFVLSTYNSTDRHECERYILEHKQRGQYWIATTEDERQ